MNSSRQLTGNSIVAKRIFACLFLVLAGCVVTACSNSVAPEETDFTVSFRRVATTAAPDSIYWTFSGASGVIAADPNQTNYSFPVHVSGRSVHKDTLKLDLRILSIATYHIQAWAGIDYPQIDILDKAPDSIANRLLIQYDSISKKNAGPHPWTHLGVQAFYADQLFLGKPLFTGYPKNCPNGLDTLAIDSLILSTLLDSTRLDSKDSVGRHLGVWGLNWTPGQVKSVYRRWLGTGHLVQGRYETLYPFDDLPPTTRRKLGFTGTADTTTILLGGDAVKLEGEFADDTGIVGISIRIFSTSGGDAATDATSKFVLDTAAFPATAQKSWDLSGQYSIKTTTAPNGSYQLQMILRDHKGQTDTATYNFSVQQPGGKTIDTIAPSITPVLPATRTLTVEDTVKSYLVRFSVRDENLKTVVLDTDTVHPVNGIVEKTVPLVEGKTVTIRIFAADSFKNSSSDSVQITRKVAVPPTLKPIHPVSRRDSVSDTTYTYSFQWQVDGIDIDSVAIDTSGVFLIQKIAEKTLPLKLGGTTRIRIRVVDKLRHVAIDSMDVLRSASVPPAIKRVGLSDILVTVPDTQSYYTANWTVSDNNLQTVSVLGLPVTLSDGGYGATVFLKAGDTARLSVRAQDKLGSVTTDTVKVRRPDPRAHYLADIDSAQRGDSVVALTDFVLPNVRFGRFEVTADLYAKVMKLAAPTTPGLPVANVNIYEAMLFCNAMSKAKNLDTLYAYSSYDPTNGYLDSVVLRDTIKANAGMLKGFRMPTRAEWTTAASLWGANPWGGSTDVKVVSEYAILSSAALSPTGSRNPTGYGLFDLAGNVAEWTSENRGNVDDLTSWAAPGGSFSETTTVNFGSASVWVLGTTRSSTIGFRVVRIGKD